MPRRDVRIPKTGIGLKPMVLADPLWAVVVGFRCRAADQLVEHLGVARRIRVGQLLRNDAAPHLADPIVVAVIDDSTLSALSAPCCWVEFYRAFSWWVIIIRIAAALRYGAGFP